MNKTILTLTLLLLTSAITANGQEWTQWRGPARDGSVSAKNAPAKWPETFHRTWRVDVGEGYSSPVVANGRVFVHTRRDPEEIVSGINLADGKLLWQQKYQAVFNKNQYAVQMAKGPNSTPLVIGNRLFTIGVTAIVNAWDTESGKLLWTRDFSKSIDTSKLFCGTAASPIAVDGRVIVQVGSDIHGGQILALNPATGATEWEWKGLGPGYASPVVFDIGGTKHLVTLTQGSIVGVDAKTGKELWSVPFPDEYHENITTPLWTGTHLVVSGTRAGTHAYSLAQSAGKWQVTEAWKNADVGMYMSSPVFGDGVIYGHSSKKKGQFVAVDAKTGAVKWATEGREGEHASLLLTPQHVVFL
ncbi:MAG TPA: PQQ-binding-like beta-propeller repeat protein, partial [Pyrinomonadaceae bacterium]|nr:PQQ-binding-like beta-propeller repeat protein [Pyrinomonadaceae bacterium]